MRRNKTSILAPGGAMLLGGLGAVIVLFLVWQFVIPFFFNRPTTNANKEPEKIPTITGRVVDAATGTPVADATVVAGNNNLAQVDSSGTFTITQKLPETPVVVAAPGYVSSPISSTIKTDTSLAIELKPNVLNGQLIDADSQQPLPDKAISFNGQTIMTDSAGKFTVSKVKEGDKLAFSLKGWEKVEQTVQLSKLDGVTLATRSTSLSGVLTDSETGKGVPNAYITINKASAEGDRDGKFTFDDVARSDTAQIKVRAPGYRIQTFGLKDVIANKGAIKLVPFKFQGIYVPGAYALKPNYDKAFTPYLKLAEQGKINAIVMDIKDDDTGKLWYDSKVPIAQELKLIYDNAGKGYAKENLIDLKKVLDEAHKRNIYMVARYVVYRDPAIASAKPEWALKSKKTGKSWQDLSDLVWPNIFVPEVRDYNVALAQELAGYGFDEVQFDYIRLPSDGALRDISFGDRDWISISGPGNEKLRTDAVEATVSKAYNALKNTDTYFSLDVFGYSLWLPDDVGIGQQYNNLVRMADYICPMVYPSHFETGTLGYKNPGLYPKEIIAKSGEFAAQLESKIPTVARYRPWLEDFPKNYGPKDLQYKNTPERVKAQIDAAIASPTASGWTLWNANGDYTESVLPKVK